MLRSRPTAGDIPFFRLYGENLDSSTPELIHCESIAERSRLHNWEIKPHRHHGLFQLLWLEEGNALCQLDDVRAELQGGMALIVPQHCVHGFHFSADARGLVVTVAYSLLSSLSISISQDLGRLSLAKYCHLGEGDGRVEAALRDLNAEYLTYGVHREALMTALLSVALGWLLRLSGQSAADGEMATLSRGRQHIARFIRLVDAGYARQAGLDDYASRMGISTAHLNALCRQVAGQSALSIIHARTLREARRMLVYTSVSVRGIADALGFSDPAYFTRFFKRHTGMSPRDFRVRAAVWTGEDVGGGLP